MQTTKFQPLFNLVAVNKKIIRTVTVAKPDAKLKSWKEIPGPSSLPIIGQLHHFMPGGICHNMEAAESYMKLFRLYGPIVRFDRILSREPMVLFSDPECSEHILRSENSFPIRLGLQSLAYYRKEFKKNRGHTIQSLLTDQGQMWKDFRSTVNPVLLQPKTIKQYSTVLDEVAQDMIKRLKANRDEKNMISNEFDKEMNLWALESIGTVALGCRLNCFDPKLKANRDEKNMISNEFDKEMNLWALESIGTVALGCRLNCFDPKLPADSPEWQLIQCTHDLFVIANELDFKPSIWKWFSTPMFKKAMKLYEHHENLTKHFIQKGKEKLKNKSDNEKGVLGKLLEINEEVAHIMASDMLFAGVDTTANTVTATLYLLAKHPDKQAKLREEIMSNSERRPYLRACVKESLRRMPVLLGNIRMTSKEYNVLGYKIPKDMQVIFAHRDMSLMDENYPKPREYIPERWLASKDDPLYYGNANPFAHQPFGFGVRSCIGRRIAELELDTFVARLIENFQVEWFGPPPNTHLASLNYIKGPYNFVFKDVK